MTTSNTIIFGPTGKVGSVAARSAHQHGAKVFLAMRDPQKSIPGLSPEQEQAGGFERVQADLTKPETIHAAVTKTGAKRAFIYIVFGSPDNLRSSLEALKSAGIEFVVFLSSATVQGDARSMPPTNFVAWAHAQVEVGLEETFGADGFVAVRPAYFATNALWWKGMVREGEVKVPFPEAKLDWITPGDIGRVCGALLAAGGGTDGQNAVPLVGPELVSQRDAVGIIGRAVGRDIKVTELDEEEGLDMYVNGYGLPEPVGKQLIDMLRKREESVEFYKGLEEAAGNVRKHTGGPPTKLQEWVDEHKQEFGG
jgi:uncharacterized protein YbjT (DUF2867 family)